MLSVDSILRRVIELQKEHGKDALLKPKGHDGFEYGKQHGKYLAFEIVVGEIQHLLEEDAKSDTLGEKDDE